jgi:hypothetical protein
MFIENVKKSELNDPRGVEWYIKRLQDHIWKDRRIKPFAEKMKGISHSRRKFT